MKPGPYSSIRASPNGFSRGMRGMSLRSIINCVLYLAAFFGIGIFLIRPGFYCSLSYLSHEEKLESTPLSREEKSESKSSTTAAATMEDLVHKLFEATSSERLTAIAEKYKKEYAENAPFPHIAIDNIFPKDFLLKVLDENPESLIGDSCNGKITEVEKTRFAHGFVCKSEKTVSKKSAIFDEMQMGTYTRLLFHTMKSSPFVHFLEELSSIMNLIPDPHYFGSGIHMTDGNGGKLDIHADFNRLEPYKLERRVNTFIFLNDNWEESYGGHLELWSKDMKACMQHIPVKLGRFVVFSSTDFSYHGHPEPMTAKGRVRRSMALYYYTNGRPENECVGGKCDYHHSTLYQKPKGCDTCHDEQCKEFNETKAFPFA